MNDANKIFELYAESKEEPQMHVDMYGKHWYRNGERHREDGPAIEYADGTKHWYINGERHRVDGPAIEHANGIKSWYKNGELHRVDGPAIEYADGSKHWCINGKEYKDVAAWARAALMYEHKPVTQQNIDAKVAQVMQQDLFS